MLDCLGALAVLMPKLSEVVHTDTEMEVVNAALDALTELLKDLKGLVLKSEGHLDAVVMCIKNVFNKAVSWCTRLRNCGVLKFLLKRVCFAISDAVSNAGAGRRGAL